jgi:glycosyltransferase involved in cell wall biosynthesis
MERPIIASNVPGCREIVVDGSNGFLCEVQNTSSLIACMMHMLALPEETRIIFGRNGRELVHRLYDEEIIIQLYKEKLIEFLPE